MFILSKMIIYVPSIDYRKRVYKVNMHDPLEMRSNRRFENGRLGFIKSVYEQ